MEMLATLPTTTQASDEPDLDAGNVLRQAIGTQPEPPAMQTEAEDQSDIRQETSPAWWSTLRIFEVVVLICALATGLAALYLRRTGRG
jgi:anti-sigma factor RsiW